MVAVVTTIKKGGKLELLVFYNGKYLYDTKYIDNLFINDIYMEIKLEKKIEKEYKFSRRAV